MIDISKGMTDTEKILASMSKKTFLNLWSYPNTYFKKNYELCDLLIVCDNHVILFSDKNISFPNTGDIKLDWQRWFNRAIKKSLRQLIRAEKWIRKKPDEIYLDVRCLTKLPISLPKIENIDFHLIIVANGATARCEKFFEGSNGSLMFSNQADTLPKPFTFGDENPNGTFVHILDDFTLPILLGDLNTISDFIKYLQEKEEFLRGSKCFGYSGEEHLLAHYLTNFDDKKEKHIFWPLCDTNNLYDDMDKIYIAEKHWEKLKSHPQYLKKREEDKISFFWDDLINQCADNILAGGSVRTGPILKHHEGSVRYMALEPRVQRRMLAKILLRHINKFPDDYKMMNMTMLPSSLPHTAYIFFQMPYTADIYDSYDVYKQNRSNLLYSYCLAAKATMPDLEKIIGMATEPLKFFVDKPITQTMMLFRCSKHEWTDELQREGEQIKNKLNIFQEDEMGKHIVREKEFPI